jgi:hypothetical protein
VSALGIVRPRWGLPNNFLDEPHPRKLPGLASATRRGTDTSNIIGVDNPRALGKGKGKGKNPRSRMRRQFPTSL